MRDSSAATASDCRCAQPVPIAQGEPAFAAALASAQVEIAVNDGIAAPLGGFVEARETGQVRLRWQHAAAYHVVFWLAASPAQTVTDFNAEASTLAPKPTGSPMSGKGVENKKALQANLQGFSVGGVDGEDRENRSNRKTPYKINNLAT